MINATDRLLTGAALLASALPAAAQDSDLPDGSHADHVVSAAPVEATTDKMDSAPEGMIEATDVKSEPQTRLLPNYGNGGFPITTSSPEAQAFFDNGMELSAAFAHKSAIAAMA